MISVDFHTHTNASKDSMTTPEEFISASRRKRLGRVVVTDHDTISGAQLPKNLAPDLIIVGEEIMTTRGEILAAFVTEEVPGGLSPIETIQRLKCQGAFISVSHPFDAWRSGAWNLADLIEILPLVDAIETFNSRCMFPGANRKAMDFAKDHDIPGTAGSDSHAPFEIGASAVILPEFGNGEELRKVIRLGKVSGHRSPIWVHFFSRYAHFRK